MKEGCANFTDNKYCLKGHHVRAQNRMTLTNRQGARS
jgi:hypothetical protein